MARARVEFEKVLRTWYGIITRHTTHSPSKDITTLTSGFKHKHMRQDKQTKKGREIRSRVDSGDTNVLDGVVSAHKRKRVFLKTRLGEKLCLGTYGVQIPTA